MNIANVVGTRFAKFLHLTTCIYSLGYLLLAGACLIRWGALDPWSRFDVFAGGYLLLRTLGSVHSVAAGRRVFRSPQVMQEWWATNSDPGGIRRVMILMALDLTVFLDYAHWHLWALLERPTLQACGLTLYAGAMAWQMWADSYLAKFFAGGPHEGTPMREGPYRFVRHPRYAAALAGKVAFALVFANVLGWLMVLAWGTLLLRKVEVEEAHLRELFGRGYEAYQQTTAKLLPGIY
jgi:protein-S-isoprenylcysteine O-methyltransferase Ste14